MSCCSKYRGPSFGIARCFSKPPSDKWLDGIVVASDPEYHVGDRPYHDMLVASFNGTGSLSFDVGSSNDNAFGACTIERWFFLDSSQSGSVRVLWSLGNSAYRLFVQSNGNLYVLGATDTSVAAPLDQWFHVAVDYNQDGLAIAMRLDFSTVWSGLSGVGDTLGVSKFFIGSRDNGTSEGLFLEGEASGGKITLDDGTILCQNDLQGNSLDASGNGNHLMLSGGVSYFVDNSAELKDADRVNAVGYGTSDGTDIPIGEIVPAHATLEGVDYLGNPLTYGAGYPAKPQPRQSSALSLNGVDQYVDTGINPQSEGWTSIDLQATVRTTSSTSQTILGGNTDASNRAFLKFNTGSIQIGVGDVLLTHSASFDDGVWRDYRLTSDGSSYEFSVDGVVVESGTHGGNLQPNIPFIVGRHATSATQFLDGQISNVKINGTHFPLAAGAGDVDYATDGTQATLVGAPSWTTQDEYHYNHDNGFQLYENGASKARYPLGITVTPPAGYTKTADYKAIDGHNFGEYVLSNQITEGGNKPPALADLPDDLAPGDSFADNFFWRYRLLDGLGYDRIIGLDHTASEEEKEIIDVYQHRDPCDIEAEGVFDYTFDDTFN